MGPGRRKQRSHMLYRNENIAVGFHSGKFVLYSAVCRQPQGLAQGRGFLTRAPASRHDLLSERLFNLGQPIGPLQYFAWFGTIRGAHNAVSLHQIDEMRGTPVANA
jgi:hypothetical protein